MRALFTALLFVTCACSGARPAPSSILENRFDTPEAQAAAEAAPDLYAAASRARRNAGRADAAGRRAVAEDHATRARILLDAAIAEAERLALEQERLDVEAREAETDLAHGRAVSRREEILAVVRRRESSRVAIEEARAAFEQAVEDEGRRYRGRSEERATLHREAAAVLARRAHLLIAAAEAEGADAEAVSPVSALLERADGTNDPARKLQLTEEAVRAAMVALGSARRQRDGPTADERAALVEAAAEAGFTVEQRDRGLTVVVPSVFRGSGAAPSAPGTRRLRRLAAMIQAHPHGAIQVFAHAQSGNSAARRRAATARATRAVNLLIREGVSNERVEGGAVVDAAGDAVLSSIEATFVAFGPEVR